jgi:hypothetical protein
MGEIADNQDMAHRTLTRIRYPSVQLVKVFARKMLMQTARLYIHKRQLSLKPFMTSPLEAIYQGYK